MATSHMIGPLRVGALQGNDSAVVLGLGTVEMFSTVRITRGTSTLVGPVLQGSGAQLGRVVLSQATTVSFSSASVEKFTIGLLPANSQLLDILIDVVTVWDPATSTLSVGDDSASSLFMGSGSQVDLNSAGRVPGSAGAQRFNGAQVGSMWSLAEAKTVRGFILNSTAPTQGSLRATLIYVAR